MAITKKHIRFFIYFAFHLKNNAADAIPMLCAAYGENVVSHALHVKDGIKNFVKETSVLKMNRVLDALKRLKRTNYKHC